LRTIWALSKRKTFTRAAIVTSGIAGIAAAAVAVKGDPVNVRSLAETALVIRLVAALSN